MIKGMQEVIDVMTKAKADLDKNGGLKQVISDSGRARSV